MIISWLISISPIMVSALAGVLYGYSFLLQQHLWMHERYTLRARLRQMLFFIARIVILLATAKYLLRSERIPSILGVVVFIALFWLVLLKAKVSK